MEKVNGDWLRKNRKEKGLTLLQVAEALGYNSPGAIGDFEAGRRPISLDLLPKIAVLFGYPVEDLAIEQGGELKGAPSSPRHRIPVYAIVSAGPETEAVTRGEEPLDYEPAASPADGLHALEIQGESMEPMLRTGDRVVVDPREPAGDCDMVVAQRRDTLEYTIKLYVRYPDGFYLVPLNSASNFKATRYDARVWHIDGVVVKVILRNARGRFRWLIDELHLFKK